MEDDFTDLIRFDDSTLSPSSEIDNNQASLSPGSQLVKKTKVHIVTPAMVREMQKSGSKKNNQQKQEKDDSEQVSFREKPPCVALEDILAGLPCYDISTDQAGVTTRTASHLLEAGDLETRGAILGGIHKKVQTTPTSSAQRHQCKRGRPSMIIKLCRLKHGYNHKRLGRLLRWLRKERKSKIERCRVESISAGITRLRDAIPRYRLDESRSRLTILRGAIEYIRYLVAILDSDEIPDDYTNDHVSMPSPAMFQPEQEPIVVTPVKCPPSYDLASLLEPDDDGVGDAGDDDDDIPRTLEELVSRLQLPGDAPIFDQLEMDIQAMMMELEDAQLDISLREAGEGSQKLEQVVGSL